MHDGLMKHIAEEADDMYSSWRWKAPDTPGSARVKTLADRVPERGTLAACRESKAGCYLLTVLERYEETLNDDWTPEQIAGLPLDAAREFIRLLADQLRSKEPDIAVNILREHYTRLQGP